MKEANEMWSRIIFAGKDAPGQEIQKAAGQLFIEVLELKLMERLHCNKVKIKDESTKDDWQFSIDFTQFGEKNLFAIAREVYEGALALRGDRNVFSFSACFKSRDKVLLTVDKSYMQAMVNMATWLRRMGHLGYLFTADE